MEEFNKNVNSYIIDEDTKKLFARINEDIRKDNIYHQAKEQGQIQEKIELCKNMKNEGIPIETIVKISGLSVEEVLKL